MQRRVAGHQDELGAMAGRHPGPLWTTAVVATSHTRHASERLPGGEPQVAHVEITPLEVLIVSVGIGLGVPGQVILPLLANAGPVATGQDAGVVVPRLLV